MTMKRRTIMKAAALAAVAAPSIARGQGAAIRIGEINSYTAQPAFLAPYRNGWNLALEEANAAGGVNGRRLETVFRDDAGKPRRRRSTCCRAASCRMSASRSPTSRTRTSASTWPPSR